MTEITLILADGAEVAATHDLEGSPLYVYAEFPHAPGIDPIRVFQRDDSANSWPVQYRQLPAFAVKIAAAGAAS